ncbi:uncharacterized protein LOC127249748 [Andrographis paniculata]|uniref:uncharacterized protein LOC127249748 n=1 Tax=Andrographis paniculata TaxID=175694 RepID=UPI0021E860DF|nr:uncharacterized protein LOC127249748 [Andrographis paniculata]XP_051128666.1 uncharacterized protein LOC127249748 [Andrographis paniculata]XP_051128675.1 uncharacterized protein LOC127249748 [Andrographis paniculata]XP_051128686.1 uncharacterized protein LOC127249748 [Andrographis paniculata]XP_051128695.1 uncharacterized protein LOC127249748 [Andrographis paniculata]XP_051128703.1 uncharacterized protein LOC127249748 [Andrographis paniculata]XP_051128712.1 uncharacterized protein LOC12724
MLSGLKFIPRDQINEEKEDIAHNSRKSKSKSAYRKEKRGAKSKRSHYSSSDDEGPQKINDSRKKKRWYDSEEDLSSQSGESGSLSDPEHGKKKHTSGRREKKRHDGNSGSEYKSRSKKKGKSKRKEYSSDNESSSASESEKSMRDEGKGSEPQNSNSTLRKEMGLDWMLQPKDNSERISDKSSHIEPVEAPAEELKKDNPRELNPYLKDNGSGYPEESDEARDKQLLSTVVVGDGGASWRLKALKRAQEQAAREGRQLQEVVEERWGSMGHFAASVASRGVAPTHAHLQAIKSRRRGWSVDDQKSVVEENDETEKNFEKRSVEESRRQNYKMRVPKNNDTLSWGKRENKKLSAEDSALVSVALSSLNKFSNDGNFMDKFIGQNKGNSGDVGTSSDQKERSDLESPGSALEDTRENSGTVKPAMSANQLAAKALQLRMKGNHEGAEILLKEAEKIKEKQNVDNEFSKPRIDGTRSRLIMHDVSAKQKRKEDDADLHLAQKIMHNHRYNTSNQADEEYDYDDAPRKRNRKKGGDGNKKSSSEMVNHANRFLTQQERCQFCFKNPSRPKHLVVAIANFTYLSLPQQQPVVPGHCCILTLQHESSTRTVDDNVWDEIRNFKKCLIMMFAKQEMDVVFLETVMGLAQQRRHCMVECIPLPQHVAKQAPVYFKKAIDEAEDEWSQHNAKKLIDTSEKGLRSSIPKNFPYFHIEFGLKRGFVHVIDDERQFKSSFGHNVVRGMLQLPAEDMNRRSSRRYESVEIQKQAVSSFARDWEPFDWTKQLD